MSDKPTTFWDWFEENWWWVLIVFGLLLDWVKEAAIEIVKAAHG